MQKATTSKVGRQSPRRAPGQVRPISRISAAATTPAPMATAPANPMMPCSSSPKTSRPAPRATPMASSDEVRRKIPEAWKYVVVRLTTPITNPAAAAQGRIDPDVAVTGGEQGGDQGRRKGGSHRGDRNAQRDIEGHAVPDDDARMALAGDHPREDHDREGGPDEHRYPADDVGRLVGGQGRSRAEDQAPDHDIHAGQQATPAWMAISPWVLAHRVRPAMADHDQVMLGAM